jgi:hypothetical protein
MAGPGASRLGSRRLGRGRRRLGRGSRRRSGAASAANAGHELITQSGQRRLESCKRASGPVGFAGARNGIIAGKGNVENVVGIVGRVAIDRAAVTGSAERVGDLTNQWWAVVAVGVTPDAVELK